MLVSSNLIISSNQVTLPDCEKVGQTAHQASRFRTMCPKAVPVSRVEVSFLAGGKRGP